MNIEGVWKVEMLGPYGWENISTVFLEEGISRGASKDHYSTGTYTLQENFLTIASTMTVHGKVRSLFGKREARINAIFEGEVKGDEVTGKATDSEGEFGIQLHMKKLASL